MAPWTPLFKIKVSKQEQIRAKYRLGSSIAKQIIDQAKANFCRKISIILGQIWADTSLHMHRYSRYPVAFPATGTYMVYCSRRISTCSSVQEMTRHVYAVDLRPVGQLAWAGHACAWGRIVRLPGYGRLSIHFFRSRLDGPLLLLVRLLLIHSLHSLVGRSNLSSNSEMRPFHLWVLYYFYAVFVILSASTGAGSAFFFSSEIDSTPTTVLLGPRLAVQLLLIHSLYSLV